MKPTVESLRIKIKQASEILIAIPEVKAGFEEYAVHVEDPKDIQGYVSDIVWGRLATLGIYQDDTSHELLLSQECSEGEARRLFCEDGEPRIPVIRFKKMWAILKGSSEATETKSEKSDIEKLIESNKPVAEWKDDKLVAEYDVNNDVVVDEMMKRSKGRPFIAYDAVTGEINRALTLNMLREARKRETPREIKDNNQLYLLRLANEAPDAVYDECPIHNNTMLVNGYCSVCGESWNGTGYDARGFVRVMCSEGDGPKSKLEIKAILQMAKDGVAKLSSEFAKIFTAYDRLVKTGSLPSCRRSSDKTVKDPFRPGHNSY